MNKNIPKILKKNFCSSFFNQSAFDIQKVATYYKEQNK